MKSEWHWMNMSRKKQMKLYLETVKETEAKKKLAEKKANKVIEDLTGEKDDN